MHALHILQIFSPAIVITSVLSGLILFLVRFDPSPLLGLSDAWLSCEPVVLGLEMKGEMQTPCLQLADLGWKCLSLAPSYPMWTLSRWVLTVRSQQFALKGLAAWEYGEGWGLEDVGLFWQPGSLMGLPLHSQSLWEYMILQECNARGCWLPSVFCLLDCRDFGIRPRCVSSQICL